MQNSQVNIVPPVSKWKVRAVMVLIIGVPALTVIVDGSFTIYRAFSTDTPIIPSYYKVGMHSKEDISDVNQAKALGIKAELQLSDNVQIVLNKAVNENTLTLEFRHPTLDTKDIRLVIKKSDKNPLLYIGEKVDLGDVDHWYVALSHSESQWKISGILDNGDTDVKLEP